MAFKHTYFIQLLLITINLSLPLIAAESDIKINKKKSAQEVAVISASEHAVLIRQLLGIVFTHQTQILSSEVVGIIVSKRLPMGYEISKGDVIAKLDDQEAQAKLSLAQAEMSIAKIRVKQKGLLLDRMKTTYDKGVTSKAEYEKADLQYQQAQAELIMIDAKSQLAKLHLNKHTIVAPFDGLLVNHSPVVGKQLMPGERIVEVLNNEQLRIKVFFSLEELSQLKKGLAQLVLKSKKDIPLVLKEMSPIINSKSGMIEAEFSLPKFHERFFTGQAISLQLITNIISVPQHAISVDNAGQYVLIETSGKARRVAINDLKTGQQVIVMGPDNLLPGDAISVVSIGSSL